MRTTHKLTTSFAPEQAGGREVTATIEITDPVQPRDTAPLLGVQFHGTWDMYWRDAAAQDRRRQHLRALADLGVRLIRLDVGWSTSEPTERGPLPVQYYNQRVSTVLAEARQLGIEVLVTVHQSPAWSRPGTGSEVKQYPQDLEALGAWCTWAVDTWGGDVLAWEVWNEPNLREFTGVADATQRAAAYVPVLKAAAAGLRAAGEQVTVVFGGPSYQDDDFVRRCYRAGARGHFDVMAVHPYMGNKTLAPDIRDADIRERVQHAPNIFAVMEEFGDKSLPVWWTEFGYSVHANTGIPASEPWRFGVPDDGTAVGQYLTTLELARGWPQVKAAIMYTAWRESSDPHLSGFSLINQAGSPRQQLRAAAMWAADYVPRVDLPLPPATNAERFAAGGYLHPKGSGS